MRDFNQDERAQLLIQIEEQASNNEKDYWGCSQAVLEALQTNFDIGNVGTFMAASAFAGGIASNRAACGALIGGVMAIGVAYGRKQYEPGKVGIEQPDLVECSSRARQLCDRFREQFGSLRCQEIRTKMGFTDNAGTAELTPQRFRDHDRCGYVAGVAARLAAEVILEPSELYQPQVEASLDMMRRLRQQMAEEKNGEKER